MAITKTWKIEKIITMKNFFQLNDVANKVHLSLTVKNDGENNTPLFSVTHNVWAILDLPDAESNFVPFDQITEEMMMTWAKNSLGPAKILEIEKQGVWSFVDIVAGNQPDVITLEEALLPWAPVTDLSVPDLSGNSGTTDNTGSSGYSGS